jgi:mono/diheme cytochrome c family protein
VVVGLRNARWCIAALALGCGEASLSNTQAGVAELVPAESVCRLLDDEEALIGVSPEGEAWFEGENGVRLMLPDGTSTPVDADFTRADALVAWDTQSAFVIGDNSLWNTTIGGAQPVSLPPELGKPRFVCGNPADDAGAFVITTRGLFEKSAGDWLRWSFPLELLETMEIRDLQGACSGREPVMYMEAGDRLWEVRYGERASLREAADFTGMVAGGPDPRIGFVAMRDGELFRFDGEAWAGIPFDEGNVDRLSTADGVIWATVGSDLYRRNRYDEWERMDVSLLPSEVTELRGYAAGGAWVVQDTLACHVQTFETLRVSGIRPFGRLAEGSTLSVAVDGSLEMEASLSARVDGTGVQVTGGAGAWSITSTNELSPGWHTLALNASSPSGPVERTVTFLVEGAEAPAPPMTPPPGEPTVTWADIAPIYERSCAMCHGEEGNQTFMGTFEAFSALGELALARVSAGEMPPPASTAPPLTEEEVQLLETWVQEGMNP